MTNAITDAREPLREFERGGDLDLSYGLAAAHNRHIVEFCRTDRRLLPVGYLPLGDLDRAISDAERHAFSCDNFVDFMGPRLAR